MSRYLTQIDATKAREVFGEEAVPPNLNKVTVAHGYDSPCYSYFCDVLPDCEFGIFYGMIGLTKELDRWEYQKAMEKLGLDAAINAVGWDIPY